jgi:hypothetical protein
VLFEGVESQPVAVTFRVLVRCTARIEERGEGCDKKFEPAIAVESFQQPAAEPIKIYGVPITLTRQSDHKEYVDPVGPVPERLADGILDLIVRTIESLVQMTDPLIMRFECDLNTPARQRAADMLKIIVSDRRTQLDDNLIVGLCLLEEGQDPP